MPNPIIIVPLPYPPQKTPDLPSWNPVWNSALHSFQTQRSPVPGSRSQDHHDCYPRLSELEEAGVCRYSKSERQVWKAGIQGDSEWDPLSISSARWWVICLRHSVKGRSKGSRTLCLWSRVPLPTVMEIPHGGSASQMADIRRKEERENRATKAILCLLLQDAKGPTQFYLHTATRKCSAR